MLINKMSVNSSEYKLDWKNDTTNDNMVLVYVLIELIEDELMNCGSKAVGTVPIF